MNPRSELMKIECIPSFSVTSRTYDTVFDLHDTLLCHKTVQYLLPHSSKARSVGYQTLISFGIPTVIELNTRAASAVDTVQEEWLGKML